jgi:hypothetical protein
MHGLSKSRIVEHRQCPRRLWLKVNRPELEEVGDGVMARFAAGNTVGDVARTLYPNGVLVEQPDLAQALLETARLMFEPPRPLFEATFQKDGVLVRVDLLLPDGDRWRLAEVKSSTSVKPYHLTDAAVQAWVLRQSGVALSTVEIAHIDTSFVYPGEHDYRGLLNHVDITAEIAGMEAEIPAWIAAARETLSGPDPETACGAQCHDPFECPFLGFCSPPVAGEEFPVEILPYGGKVAAQLREEGYKDLREVPEGRLSNPKHVRVWNVTRENLPVLDAAAGGILRGLPYPRHYLDFETMQFVVPIWAGTRPYAQVPFQWSCHVEGEVGVISHREFLADGTGDPRREFAETLVEVLGDAGPILVYSAFEATRMRELAEAFPALALALNAAIARIVDLLPIARNHYCHPEMRGSWSIKAVLPTIAPDLAYDDLAVSDGGMAQEAFGEMLLPETTPERRAELREGLLRYCERDTVAMVRVARRFQDATGMPPAGNAPATELV